MRGGKEDVRVVRSYNIGTTQGSSMAEKLHYSAGRRDNRDNSWSELCARTTSQTDRAT